jgi:hypothetical protein
MILISECAGRREKSPSVQCQFDFFFVRINNKSKRERDYKRLLNLNHRAQTFVLNLYHESDLLSNS